MTRRGTHPEQCATHPGFIAGNCARCIAGPVMDVPRADSTRKMHPATTTAAARARRLAATDEATQRSGKHKLTPAQAAIGRAKGLATMRAKAVAAAAEARRRAARPPVPKPERVPAVNARVLWITFRGETRQLCEWAEHFGVASSTIRDRYSYGVPLDAPRTVGVAAPRGTWDYVKDCEVRR